jgi:hypothetical protein
MHMVTSPSATPPSLMYSSCHDTSHQAPLPRSQTSLNTMSLVRSLLTLKLRKATQSAVFIVRSTSDIPIFTASYIAILRRLSHIAYQVSLKSRNLCFSISDNIFLGVPLQPCFHMAGFLGIKPYPRCLLTPFPTFYDILNSCIAKGRRRQCMTSRIITIPRTSRTCWFVTPTSGLD